MSETLGHVTAVSGWQITLSPDPDHANGRSMRVGAMIKVRTADCEVVGVIGAVQVQESGLARATVDLLGEIVSSPEGRPLFSRGVSQYPISGAPVLSLTEGDLMAVYARSSAGNIRIGTLYEDPVRPALVAMDKLLATHFAVFGMTGSGKSCGVVAILSAILADHPNAHIVVLDLHNEYATAFGGAAEAINVDNLLMPLWLLNFEEAAGVLVRGGTTGEQESQVMILKEAITRARGYSARDDLTSSITVDTPVPFRISDLIRFIDEAMGQLDNPDTTAPYLRLKTRLDSLRRDRRFAFLFSDRLVVRDTMAEVVGRLLRVPVSGKPITVFDLSGIPSEITDVLVSLLCRIIFDFCRWSERERMPPVLLVCEEAHRYVPADERLGFAATAREITQIAKEGRKYGISLALISQRPSEISASALSQCGTIFALRLANNLDQHYVASALPDAARAMLTVLPSLGTQEAIACGDGVSLPMRIRFNDLPPERLPRSLSAEFSKAWTTDSTDASFLEDCLRRWRQQIRNLPRVG